MPAEPDVTRRIIRALPLWAVALFAAYLAGGSISRGIVGYDGHVNGVAGWWAILGLATAIRYALLVLLLMFRPTPLEE